MAEIHKCRDESISIDYRLTVSMSVMMTREQVAQPGAAWANLLVRAHWRRRGVPHLLNHPAPDVVYQHYPG